MTVNEAVQLFQELADDLEYRYVPVHAYSETCCNEPDIADHTINTIYYRNGEVVLQSNEVDELEYNISLPYIIHCLRYFDGDDTVVFMDCDDDNDYDFHDIVDIYLNEDDKVILSCSER